MIFAMARPCPADWQRVCPARSEFAYFCADFAQMAGLQHVYGMQFWVPQIVKAFGFSNAQTGFVTAVPYLFVILWARHSDAKRERVAHVGLPLLLTAVSLGICGYMDNPYVTMVALIVAAIGVFCTFAVFWTLPTAWLSGTPRPARSR
jgi:hypothetical protein